MKLAAALSHVFRERVRRFAGYAQENRAALSISPDIGEHESGDQRMLIVPWEALGGPRWRNTKRIPSATGKAAYRIPDGLTRTHLYEVKNVTGKLSLTSQLKDLEIYSQQTNRQFVQIHKKGLKFSKPLQKLIDDRIIITLELP